MGVKGLYGYLKAYRHDLDLASTTPYRIGVDAMSLLYCYKSSYPDVFYFLDQLKEKGHKILFVLDGKSPAEKGEIVKERREARQSATTQATTLKSYLTSPAAGDNLTEKERKVLEFSLARLEHQSWHVTKEIRHAFQDRLKEVGIPFVKAAAEADDVLIDLAGAGKLDVVISSDMDYLLSGVPRLWIPSKRGFNTFEEIVTQDVIEGEGLGGPAGLMDAGILAGVEPLRGQLSVPIHVAFGWIRYYGSIEQTLTRPTIRAETPDLVILEDPTKLAEVRQHFQPRESWLLRLREDQHLLALSVMASWESLTN
jgi:5'-3' exonuclease